MVLNAGFKNAQGSQVLSGIFKFLFFLNSYPSDAGLHLLYHKYATNPDTLNAQAYISIQLSLINLALKRFVHM